MHPPVSPGKLQALSLSHWGARSGEGNAKTLRRKLAQLDQEQRGRVSWVEQSKQRINRRLGRKSEERSAQSMKGFLGSKLGVDAKCEMGNHGNI